MAVLIARRRRLVGLWLADAVAARCGRRGAVGRAVGPRLVAGGVRVAPAVAAVAVHVAAGPHKVSLSLFQVAHAIAAAVGRKRAGVPVVQARAAVGALRPGHIFPREAGRERTDILARIIRVVVARAIIGAHTTCVGAR